MSAEKSFLVLKTTAGVAGTAIIFLLATNFIVTLGRSIPQTDILSDYINGILCSIVLGFSVLLWSVSSKDKAAIIIIWTIKCIVALGFMLFFEANYDSLDAYSYFDVPRQPDYKWTGFKIGDGTGNIYNLIWLYYQFMPQSYHALKVSFAMVGLLAIYIFYRSAVLFLQKEDVRLLYALALFPSILFWSSTLGKDPITLLGIALYTYGVVGWYRFKNFSYIYILALGLMIAILIRSWLGLILLTPTTFLLLKNVKSNFPKLFITGFIGFIIIFPLNQFLDQNNLAIETAQDFLVELDTWSRAWSVGGGSGQKISADFMQLDQVIKFIPLGAFTALFRPLPGEVLNFFGWLAGLENLLLLFLLSLAIIRVRRRDLEEPLVIWAVLLILTWAIVYGFISYQNLGSAVRFKLQILPILVYLLLYLGRWQQIKLGYNSSLASNGNSQ